MRVSDEGRRATLKFINIILSGKLPRAGFLLESLLVGLLELTDGANREVQPIAIGDLWYRLAIICALVQRGHEGGVALGHRQTGLGTKGGVDAVVHAVDTALESDEQNVALSFDCENAFNTLDRDATFAAVKEYMPKLLPVVRCAYGAATPLHAVGAPPGAEAIWSSRGVRQGDPMGPLLFGVTLQRLLKAVFSAEPSALPVAYLDDIALVVKPAALERAYKQLVGDGPDRLPQCGRQSATGQVGRFRQ